MKCGLIGKTLKHSYSEIIHSMIADYDYRLYELESGELRDFVFNGGVDGFNVTIPYKKEIMQYLDYIDPSAKAIGAVNTVVKRDGRICGFNTDFLGMKYMLNRAGIELNGKKVMILGSGGTGNTARAVAAWAGAKEIVTVSRSGAVNYGNYRDRRDAEIILNTTPVGMYPDNYSSPVDLDCFDSLEGVADVVYNPRLTKLLFQAEQKHIKNTGGLPMLVAQAKYAMEIFTDKTVSDGIIEDVVSALEKKMLNVVLIGMPGSGKSSIGRLLAEKLGMDFVDSDEEIEKKDGRRIPEIFRDFGEDYFRNLESEVLKELGRGGGKIIATGGGVVKRRENYFSLKNNGRIILIERSLEKLSTTDRPLSKDRLAVRKLYGERKNLYDEFADEKIENNGEIEDAVLKVMEKL